MKSSNTFTGLLEAFFTDRLIRQRQVSPHTIVSYREHFGNCSGSPRTGSRNRPIRCRLRILTPR